MSTKTQTKAKSVRVLRGDCRDLVPGLGRFDFVFADPPFNIGYSYPGYRDTLSAEDFTDFTSKWIETCWQACDGVMALHGPDQLAEMYLIEARRLGMRRIAWVNWHYAFGQCRSTNWVDARCHCLIFAKHGTHTWNDDAVRVESARVRYGDKRINDTDRGGKRVPGTVWGIPSDGSYWGRVHGQSRERVKGASNQLPEKYLERLIRAYTNPGDCVLDPFAGSGTTAVVSQALQRRCVTIDVSGENVRLVRERLRRGAVRVFSVKDQEN